MRVIESLPEREYHAHPAISKSLLDRVARSPMHARAYLDGDRGEETPAMAFGSAFHAALLEPARAGDRYALFDGDLRTKAGKAERDAIIESGRSILRPNDASMITRMIAAVHRNNTAREYLSMTGIAESSVFWAHPASGLELRCRPDYWIQSHGIVLDIKTTRDASPAAFARFVAKYRYHVQAAHYLDGTQAERFVLIAIEKDSPHAVAVYELDEASLDLGRQAREQDIATLAVCMSTDDWPGYVDAVQTLTLPPWSFPAGDDDSDEVEISYVE